MYCRNNIVDVNLPSTSLPHVKNCQTSSTPLFIDIINGRPQLQWKPRNLKSPKYFLISLRPVLPQLRSLHSRWLAPPCGMAFHWHSDCSPEFFPTHSTV